MNDLIHEESGECLQMGLEIGLRSHLDIPRVKPGVWRLPLQSPCGPCWGMERGDLILVQSTGYLFSRNVTRAHLSPLSFDKVADGCLEDCS